MKFFKTNINKYTKAHYNKGKRQYSKNVFDIINANLVL